MTSKRDTDTMASRGAKVPRPSRVHIVRVDYPKNELFDADGNGYYELPGGFWAKFGAEHEGSIRYWGSGSHAGHINLLPAVQLRGGVWVNVMQEKQRVEGTREELK